MTRNSRRRIPPGAALCLLGLGACTQVNEQPPLPAAAEAPATTTVRRARTRPAPAPLPRRPPDIITTTTKVTVADAGRAANPETLNGDPAGLRRADLQKALDGAMPSLQPCLREAATGTMNVTLAFSASPSGRAEQVRVTGGGPAVDGCLARAVTQMKLPAFAGDPVPVQFPLSVERTVTQAAPAAAPQAPPAEKPRPIFVKP